ncbi:nitrogen regulation protein NR(II) [Brevundimonas sp.]|uniref:two-component system sensor histidine kinase NtrB n=1 Tax=Brevundimonas sp. TaxID=1871086 RepID=UPI00356713BC
MIAVGVRVALEPIGHFYYLPMVAAVMVTALLARRLSVILAITLSIIANEVMVQRQGALDATVNAVLFAVVAWAIAEVCRRLGGALRTARALTRDLAMREMLLETILTSVPIVTLDREGRTQRVTPAAAALLGVSREEAATLPFHTLVPCFDEAALESARQGGEVLSPSTGFWAVWRPNACPVPLTIHANVLPDDIWPEHIVLALAEQSQSEAMRQRERDLTEKLNSVWRLNSMGEMAATLAHEMNQPLTAAAVYLHAGQAALAKAGSPADEATRALELAKAQLLRAGEIIRRMRELLATGSRSFTEERASQMIQDLDPVFTLIGRDTDVTIYIQADGEDDHVLADRIQLQQALTNLVKNAVDAAIGQENGRVSVSGRSLGAEGYEIAVEDNGRGIPTDQRDSIFHPMISTKAGGMGLGLSVTRSIVESHGGALTVGRSKLGGAAFTFRLPHSQELDAA